MSKRTTEVVYVLLSSAESMTADGELVESFDVHTSGALRLVYPDGRQLLLAPGEWRRLTTAAKSEAYRFVEKEPVR